MRVVYDFQVSLDLGKAVGEIGALMEAVNSHLSTMGYDEKVKASGQFLTGTFECDRELTPKERKEIQAMMQKSFRERLPEYDLAVHLSYKPSKSISQSA